MRVNFKIPYEKNTSPATEFVLFCVAIVAGALWCYL
jgi:hypothetical protein